MCIRDRQYRGHVAKLKRLYNVQLERCQRAEFAVTQLDRTIAWLEQNANSLQDDLKREAAGRRKAESIIKRRAGEIGADSVDQAMATQIEMEEQIKRLTRELEATQNMRAAERQHALAEIKKIRSEVSKQASSRNRAA